jgi:hypothetical protein
MTPSRGLLTIAAILGITLCFVVHRALHTDSGDIAERGSAAAEQPRGAGATSESAQLAALRRQIAELERRVWAQERSAAGDPATHDPPAVSPRDPQIELETHAEQERRHRDYLAGLETAFHDEATDPGWSAATSAVVQTALASSREIRALGRGVECRSHICRVEITDDGRGSLGKILPTFAQEIGHELPNVAANRVQNADGTTMVLYLSRDDDAPSAIR